MQNENNKPLILIVDDTPTNIQVLAETLRADYRIKVATSGQAALDIVGKEGGKPDLILLDVMMTGMDGCEVCRRLKANPDTRDIAVIFVTAQNSPADETRGLEAGAVDFISKPVNPAVVRARVRTHLTIKHQADLLRSLAFIDGLTGIANRRQFDETLGSEWRCCRRTGSPLTLAMIDIDHFKQFNDVYGHQAGDACLRAVAEVLKANIGRAHDLIARYGGEEFACLLPSTNLASIEAKLEELRQAVQTLGIPHEGSSTAPVVTISLGVATVMPTAELSPDWLVAAADAQLYEAKRAGRNRACSAEILDS